MSAISLTVLSEVGPTSVFSDLADHMLDSTPDSNHVFNLINSVSRNYVNIRMHYLCKKFAAQIAGVKIRKRLTKLVLFNHQ